MWKPRLGVGVVAAGARWATEVLRASWCLCVQVLKEEGAPFHSIPPSDLDPNRAPLFLPSNLLASSVISSVARQTFPRPGNSPLFLTLMSTFVFRHGLLPGPPGSGHPPKWSVASPRNPPRCRTNSTLPFCAHVDLVQDLLHPNELKVYEPASKVVPTSPRLHLFSTLKSSFTTCLFV